MFTREKENYICLPSVVATQELLGEMSENLTIRGFTFDCSVVKNVVKSVSERFRHWTCAEKFATAKAFQHRRGHKKFPHSLRMKQNHHWCYKTINIAFYEQNKRPGNIPIIFGENFHHFL